jgi:hypothetical protein
MKYYLIIGYQTLEKFRDYGRIQLYFNDLLLEDFTADEENNITNIFHNTNINHDTRVFETMYHSKQPKENYFKKSIYRVYDSQPKKIKVLEIDSNEFQRANITKLTIKIVGGPSNNANGFISKRNMVVIFPVFLLPKFSFAFDLLNRVYNKMKENFFSKYKLNSYPFYIKDNEVPQPNEDGTYIINKKPLQWPGPNYVPINENSKNCLLLGQPIGNDCEINFYIHKKHKIYSIHTSPKPPVGKWQLNLCFINLYEKLIKSSFHTFDSWRHRCVDLKEWNLINTVLQKTTKMYETLRKGGSNKSFERWFARNYDGKKVTEVGPGEYQFSDNGIDWFPTKKEWEEISSKYRRYKNKGLEEFIEERDTVYPIDK